MNFPRTTALLKKIQKRKKVARHEDAQDAIQQIYLGGIRKTLAHAQLQVLHKLHAGSGKAGFANAQFANTTTVAADFMFDLDAFTKMFQVQMREAGEEALQVSGQGLLSELGIDQKYITPQGIIHDFTIDRANKLEGVPQEVYDTLKASLEEGVQNGETMDDLAGRVKQTVGNIDDGRARTIARTETASAYNTGRMGSLKQAGFTHKSWLTAHDDLVRTSHSMAADEGAIPVDQNFSNGLAYPGDPNGPAREVINCRCVLQAADAPGGGAS